MQAGTLALQSFDKLCDESVLYTPLNSSLNESRRRICSGEWRGLQNR